MLVESKVMRCDKERGALIECLLSSFARTDTAGKLRVPLGKDHALSLLLHKNCLDSIGHTQIILLETGTHLCCGRSERVPDPTRILAAPQTRRCVKA